MDSLNNITEYLNQSYSSQSIEDNFKDFDLNLFLDKIIQMKDKYHFNRYKVTPSEDFDNLFILYFSKDKTTSLMGIWDKIIDELEEYCEDNGLTEFFNNNGVVLRYG